ncbi:MULTISPECIES: bifunctional serine/threonine-protein kinase/ABC transporter substrate-binding protein [unclassified Streptomyces]|uniref:bifunctional serine/threonine-protein kinase/ABC transporter substrate-binding protein n=1 Tax=unclassified Streptomyces TaxID=2593676 RepID=UPI00036C03BD|nr:MULTISPECIES: bifunctional serine/threonine-protein kinase/ABC transporter substrate-binding protein [unclassified Streptomyces]MYQ76617.1 ABC transporter substrate-binding protein [Streptomyces sp. SID4923]
MRPLTSEDPRAIGAYRTLVRLGAGGMGVVYLARTSGGALAAVKVIHAEHAADPGFRARFRREAEAAARVTGPWTVPVTGADTEAPEPWLATAFVPGPSLGEAVGTGGPLPTATLRALGSRLAEALVAVHTAGLVHRDVKPGNVLLALDGPRLIDFGIARHEGATALTATDVVIGTPGYLAPEQAVAGPVGPGCDVFSLGCVLVYAATGRRPFGDGTPAAVLFRTVHQEPDLDGVPDTLLPLITACLAKDPAARPSAGEVARSLADGPVDWEVPGLSTTIAARSAAALALPDPAPSTAPGDVEPPRPTRRRLLAAGAAGAVALAGGGTAWVAATRRGGTSQASRPLPAYRIALHADLTGAGRTVGLAHQRGALLAIDAHNARTDKTFTLALRTEDDAGDPARARRAADRITADARVLAVIGPTSEAVDAGIVGRYEKARLAQIVVAAGSADSDAAATKSLCVLRPYDPVLAIGLISYLARVRPADHVVIIEDRADERGSWAIRDHLPKAPVNGVPFTSETVAATARTFAPAARAAVAAGAGAVVYAGSSAARGARCAKDLVAAGFTGTGMSVGPVLAPAFLRDAGEAAEGWVFAEAYTDPAALPAAEAFTAAHRERFGAPPATWAAETYDAVDLIARAARTTSAVDAPRDGVAGRILSTTYQGITRSLSFYGAHQVRPESGIFLHRVEGGRARFLGLHTSV